MPVFERLLVFRRRRGGSTEHAIPNNYSSIEQLLQFFPLPNVQLQLHVVLQERQRVQDGGRLLVQHAAGKRLFDHALPDLFRQQHLRLFHFQRVPGFRRKVVLVRER